MRGRGGGKGREKMREGKRMSKSESERTRAAQPSVSPHTGCFAQSEEPVLRQQEAIMGASLINSSPLLGSRD